MLKKINTDSSSVHGNNEWCEMAGRKCIAVLYVSNWK